jgi:hypothetical protein
MGFEVAVAPELLGSVVVTPDAAGRTWVALDVAVTSVVGLALVTLTLEVGVGAAPPAVK